jgi:alpha-tubulin suppressor-like RCC1 family protein
MRRADHSLDRLVLTLVLAVASCSTGRPLVIDVSDGGMTASGGSGGGRPGTGGGSGGQAGAVGTGGSGGLPLGTGGIPTGTGGQSGHGGAVGGSAGGAAAGAGGGTAGTRGTGGTPATGGSPGTGGTPATGGSPGTGGAAGMGGAGGSGTGGSGTGGSTVSCTGDATCPTGSFCQATTCHPGALAIAAGAFHVCVLLTDGSIRCWGANSTGQLGNVAMAAASISSTPIPVTGLPGPASAIAAGGSTTCALLHSGSVWCWGAGSDGELGDEGVFRTGWSVPVQVALSGTATAIAVGTENAYAVVNGAVWCWGNNYSGQLGIGQIDTSTVGTSTPVMALGITGATAVAGGDLHACAVAGGGVWCWGENDYGELGRGMVDTGSTIADATPAKVIAPAASGMVAVTTGWKTSCGMSASGVYCWGMNSDGEVGNGTVTSDSPYGIPTPQAVVGVTSPLTISGSTEHICAVDGAGAVRCWGASTFGALGPTTPTPGSASTVVLQSNAIAVATGEEFTCAVIKNGSAWCWGRNDSGQLGAGDTSTYAAGTQVLPW